jgi:hypothetical protein
MGRLSDIIGRSKGTAIGYVTPHTKLAGKEKEFFAQRDQKLEAARERQRLWRAEAMQNVA